MNDKEIKDIEELLINGLQQCIEYLKNNIGNTENNFFDLKNILDIMFRYRKYFRQNQKLSYSIPNIDLICHIVNFLEENNCLQVIEIGSGTGLWSSLIQIMCKLRKNDIRFIPTEYNELVKKYYGYRYFYTELENLDANSAIEKYKNSDCLFLCWPPSQSMVDNKGQYSAGEILKVFQGNYLISIGYNQRFWLTGDELFYDELEKNWIHLSELDKNMFIEFNSSYIDDIYDCIFFYKRKIPISNYMIVDRIRDVIITEKGRIISSMHEDDKERYF